MKTANLYTGIILDYHRAIVPLELIRDVKTELRGYDREVIEGSEVYNDLGQVVGRYLTIEFEKPRRLRKAMPYETALAKIRHIADRLGVEIANVHDKRVENYRAELHAQISVLDACLENRPQS